jgi:hypothetical protein
MVGNGDRVVAQGDGFDRGERGEGGRTGRDGKDSDAMMPSTDRDIIGVTSVEDSEEHLSVCLQSSRSPFSYPHPFHGLGTLARTCAIFGGIPQRNAMPR